MTTKHPDILYTFMRWAIIAKLSMFFYLAAFAWSLLATDWASLDSILFWREANGVLFLYLMAFVAWLISRYFAWRVYRIRCGEE